MHVSINFLRLKVSGRPKITIITEIVYNPPTVGIHVRFVKSFTSKQFIIFSASLSERFRRRPESYIIVEATVRQWCN